MGKQEEPGENIEKHVKTRDNVGKTGECIGTGKLFIYWGHIMKSYMRY